MRCTLLSEILESVLCSDCDCSTGMFLITAHQLLINIAVVYKYIYYMRKSSSSGNEEEEEFMKYNRVKQRKTQDNEVPLLGSIHSVYSFKYVCVVICIIKISESQSNLCLMT